MGAYPGICHCAFFGPLLQAVLRGRRVILREATPRKRENEPVLTRITPRKGPMRLSDVWKRRYLIWLFVKRDFVVYYRQTVLGPLWYLAKPLISTSVVSIIFGRVVRMPTDTVPPFLFYFLGGIVWGFFSDCYTRSSHSLSAHAHEFGRVAFPRLSVPIASLCGALLQSGLQAVLFFAVYWRYLSGGQHVIGNPLPLVPAVIQLALTGMGGGLLVAALTAKYRDFSHLSGFFLQLLYFCTPVLYPFSMVPQQWKWCYMFNPIATVAETCRVALFGTGGVAPVFFIAGWIVTVSVFTAGIVLFSHVEKTFIDTV